MNLYDQVENLLQNRDDKPEWADEILFELKEIKTLLQKLTTGESHKQRNSKNGYFAFVKKLREQMRADIVNDIFPQINYKGRELGINLKGYIYDKATTKDLSAQEAFEVYRFLYENRKNLEKYLKR